MEQAWRIFISWLPLLILVAFWIYYVRRMKMSKYGTLLERQLAYLDKAEPALERQRQHMERVEQLLERIATGLERQHH
jgi:ATP-dependent Zn protease